MSRWPNVDNRGRLAALRAENPAISAAEIAKRLGISRSRVSQILIELGLPRPRSYEPRVAWNRSQPGKPAPIGQNGHASTISSGACAELEGADNSVSVTVRRYECGSRPIPPTVAVLAEMYGRHGIPDR